MKKFILPFLALLALVTMSFSLPSTPVAGESKVSSGVESKSVIPA
jgi:hypothetical protein